MLYAIIAPPTQLLTHPRFKGENSSLPDVTGVTPEKSALCIKWRPELFSLFLPSHNENQEHE